MRKIIDDILLDTQTDKMIGTVIIDKEPYTTQTLYRTKSDLYYLRVMLGLKENICVIKTDEAQAWCKHWLTSAEYEEYFGKNNIKFKK